MKKQQLFVGCALLFLWGAMLPLCQGQNRVRRSAQTPSSYDCAESNYYLFHGNQLRKATSSKEVINSYPWRMTGQLYRNGGASGTGIYIGNRLVLTAAHCLGSVGKRPQSLSFALAQSGPGFHCNPYGKIPVKRMFVPKEWSSNIGNNYKGKTTRAYDYVILELAYEPKQANGFPGPRSWKVNVTNLNSIRGLTPYALGYATCSGAPGNSKYPPIRSTSPNGKVINLERKPGGGGLLVLRVEACAGMSGGPVFVETTTRGRQGRPVTTNKLIGIMVGSTQRACENGNIWAVAFTQETVNRIKAIKSYINNPRQPNGASTLQKIRQKMNVHRFSTQYYVKENGKCDAYFR